MVAPWWVLVTELPVRQRWSDMISTASKDLEVLLFFVDAAYYKLHATQAYAYYGSSSCFPETEKIG